MGEENKYKILIQAQIDTSKVSEDSVQKNIDKQLKKLFISIKSITIDPVAKEKFLEDVNKLIDKAGIKDLMVGLKEQDNEGVKKLQKQMNEAALTAEELKQKVIDALTAGGNRDISLGNVKTSFNARGVEQLDSMSVTYKGLNGEVEKLKYGWMSVTNASGKHQEFLVKGKEYIDNEILATKKVSDLRTEVTNEIQKSNEILAKTEGKSSSAQQVIDVKASTTAVKAKASALLDLIKSEGGITPKVLEEKAALDQLVDTQNKHASAMSAAGKNIQSWGTEIGVAIKRTLEWASAMTLLYGSLRQIQQGIKYIADLNKEMVNIQVVTGGTNAQMKDMANTFNDLANAMGVTTLEVAKGSTEWFRAGKNIEETGQLMKATLMLSKLGNLESADATDKLIATLNGFKLSANEAIGVVDRLIAVDNAFSTSSKEVATALQYSAAVAQQAGVSLNELISYVTTISSVMRVSAETVGQSLKTIFTRLEQLKVGKLFEDDPTTINNVAIALDAVGIALMKDVNTFRPMGDVLDELAKKWNTLNQKQQEAIAGTIAGVRQAPQFLVLMQHYDQVLKAQEIQLDSTGLAQERYGIYLQGVEAAHNKMIASWEKLWQVTINSDFIKWFYEAGGAVLGFTTDFGGLIPVIVAATAALIIFNATLMITKISNAFMTINFLSAAFLRLGEVLAGTIPLTATQMGLFSVTGIGLFIIALTALVGTLYYVSQSAERNAKAFRDSSEAMKATTEEVQKLQEQTSKIQSLWKEYETLRATINKTDEQQKRFFEVQKELSDLVPNMAITYDDQGRVLIDNKVTIENILALEKERLETAKALLLEQMKQAAQDAGRVFGDKKRAADEAKAQLDYMNSGGKATSIFGRSYTYTKKDIDEQQKIYQDTLRDAASFEITFSNFYKSLGTQARIDFLNEIDPSKTNAELRAKAADLEREIEDAFQAFKHTGVGGRGIATKLKLDDSEILSQIDGINKKATDLSDIMTKIGKGEDLSGSTDQLDKMGIAWSQVDGKVTVAQGAIDEYFKREIDIALAVYDIDAATRQWLATLLLAKAQATYTAKALEDVTKAKSDLQKMTVDMLKQGLNDEKDALQQQLKNIKDRFDAEKKALTESFKSRKQQLDDTHKEEKQATDDRLKSLEAEFSRIQSVISAEKDLLTVKKAEADFNAGIEEKNKSISDLQNQITSLMFDTSAEGIAKRKLLEADLAKQKKELSTTEAQRTYDLQIKALDDMQSAQQKIYDAKKAEVEVAQQTSDQIYQIRQDQFSREEDAQMASLERRQSAAEAAKQREIDAIDLQLKQEGVLNSKASSMISNDWQNTYQKLIMWNSLYGTGVANTVGLLAQQAQMAAFTIGQMAMLNNMSMGQQASLQRGTALDRMYEDYIPQHHTGIGSGTGGGNSNDEILTMITKDEIVFKPIQLDNMIKNLIKLSPALGSSSSGGGMGGISVEMPITVQGSLDNSVLPNLEKLVEKVVVKINDIARSRGNLRTTSLTSI